MKSSWQSLQCRGLTHECPRFVRDALGAQICCLTSSKNRESGVTPERFGRCVPPAILIGRIHMLVLIAIARFGGREGVEQVERP